MLSDNDFVTLNTIYLKKMATETTIAEVTGLTPDMVRHNLANADDQGWIMSLPEGAMLLSEGIDEVLAYYKTTYAEIRGEPTLASWYEAFEVLNKRFIGAVSEWQQTQGDERIERRVLQAAERLVKDIGRLLPQIPRYEAYVRRFEQSMNKVDRGQREFVCKPTIDSVHNIWFEFHEDILAVLGRPRDTT
ncbi:hypothetical protein ACVBEH_18145 [Roseateles sp. GG27B]